MEPVPEILEALPQAAWGTLSRWEENRLNALDGLWADRSQVMAMAGLDPDPWQVEIINGSWRQLLINCSRRAGKTQAVAALAVCTALLEAPATVVIVSRILRESAEVLRMTKWLYNVLSGRTRPRRRSPSFLPLKAALEKESMFDGTGIDARPLRDSVLTWELTNGSRVISLPATTDTRAYEANLLIIDEACFVAGTPVDTPIGPRPIEDLLVGDSVLNAVGVDEVVRTTRRKVSSLASIMVAGHTIISSCDHAYLTRRGWVQAQNLEVGDELVRREEAVQTLRQGVSCRTAAALLRPELREERQTIFGGILDAEMPLLPVRVPRDQEAAGQNSLFQKVLFESSFRSQSPQSNRKDVPAMWSNFWGCSKRREAKTLLSRLLAIVLRRPEEESNLRMVRWNVYSALSRSTPPPFLWTKLRIKVEASLSRSSGQDFYAGTIAENESIREAVVVAGYTDGSEAAGENREVASGAGSHKENGRHAPPYRAQAEGSWGQGYTDAQAPTNVGEGVGTKVENGICGADGLWQGTWFALHDGFGPAGTEISRGSGRKQSQGKTDRKRSAAGPKAPPARVDRVEILQSDDSRFLTLSGGRDTVEVYDISVKSHPSFSVYGLVVHNCRVPTEAYNAVRPMIRGPAKGRLVALSTPKGMRGWFWEAWQKCEEQKKAGVPEEWERIAFTAEQCPRFTKEELEFERSQIGERWYRQEYLCSWEADTGSVFRPEDIAAAYRSVKGPLSLGGEKESVDDPLLVQGKGGL